MSLPERHSCGLISNFYATDRPMSVHLGSLWFSSCFRSLRHLASSFHVVAWEALMEVDCGCVSIVMHLWACFCSLRHHVFGLDVVIWEALLHFSLVCWSHPRKQQVANSSIECLSLSKHLGCIMFLVHVVAWEALTQATAYVGHLFLADLWKAICLYIAERI